MNNTCLILDGKKAREYSAVFLRDKIANLPIVPKLVIVSIGNDTASRVYVRNKETFGVSCGALVEVQSFPEDVSADTLVRKIDELNLSSSVHGIIVQAPLPSHLSFSELTQHVDPKKDVDGLVRDSLFIPATARGILSLLSFYEIQVTGKRVVVVGRSELVGLPTAKEFLKHDSTVTICHSHTKDLAHHTKDAEILVVATGRPRMITRKHLSEGQVVIDVGIHQTEVGLVGDVDFESVKDIVSAITPVPGGVGPMTVLSLFQNLYDAASVQIL